MLEKDFIIFDWQYLRITRYFEVNKSRPNLICKECYLTVSMKTYLNLGHMLLSVLRRYIFLMLLLLITILEHFAFVYNI